jgi:XTP/dITP diphosphohydrolase
MATLLIATHNPGKKREYAELLAHLPVVVTWLDAEGVTEDVKETGVTFRENALLKAQNYAFLTGLWTLADDSGLEVDALGGRPGVYSARYGGPHASDRDRYLRLLTELAGHPQPWTARFCCVIAIVNPSGEAHCVDGSLHGVITDQARGEHGFGYDPIFFLPQLKMTLAECPPDVKNAISHRAVAARKAALLLADWLNHR